jgi:GAF domain-containing protein
LETYDATIFLREGDSLRFVSHHGPLPILSALPLSRGLASGRAVLDKRTIHVADMQAEAEEFPEGSENARRYGYRTGLVVPLMREGVAIGALGVRLTEARLFTERQVALLQTFADQAVIAIENVRLFKELEARNRELTEALDQQMATSEILQVISSSPTSLQPVLDAVAANAARVCGAYDATLLLREGDHTRRVAHHGPIPNDMRDVRPLSGRYVSNRAILEGESVHIHDILGSDREDIADAREAAPRTGYRTLLAMPLLREGEAIGALTIRRREVQPFTEKQIALLRTFADQAVIAIENVRLFTELEARNRDLTATSAILQVISSSPTDVQPVFDAIAKSALRLCEGNFCNVVRYDGEVLHLAAHAASH